MKYLSILLLSILLLNSKDDSKPDLANALEGAWELESLNGEKVEYRGVLLIQAPYAFYTEFETETPAFLGSHGGSIEIMANKLFYDMEFNTWSEAQVGQSLQITADLAGNKVTLSQETDGVKNVMTFTRIDNGEGDLAGAWRITDRMRDGEMTAMRQGSRKTIKMITGSRFQWAAFDPESKRFSGTGGGRVTLEDGKYTEHIEFFSRNSDRVGASLTFNYKVDGDRWIHSGNSSSGNPIKEIWTRQ